jgi:hypothetical protein
MPRSGTNFLYDLLLLHPECYAGLAEEDFLTVPSDLLVQYTKSVSGLWFSRWRVKRYIDQPDRLLAQYIGEGLLSFLNLKVESESNPAQFSQSRLVTKTPNVKNLQHFFTIFPDAYLIIIIRDGRAVVESGMNTFKWNFETMTRAWAEAARIILEFEQQSPPGKYLVIKYEDLYLETERQIKKILSFLNLDPTCYDFEKAANLPVRGSSQLHKKGQEYRHWKPVERTPDFNPMTRWSHWGQARHERFNWLAGKYLTQFGYCQEGQVKSSTWWSIWNVIMDVKWNFRIRAGQLKRLVKSKLF